MMGDIGGGGVGKGGWTRRDREREGQFSGWERVGECGRAGNRVSEDASG